MMRITKCALLVAAGLCAPGHALGQAGPLGAGTPDPWPRWQEAAAAPALPTVPQAHEEDNVFARAFLGSIMGWAGGMGLGLAMCQIGCGDDATDILTVAVLTGLIGTGVGSTLLGCTSAVESGCVGRVLPRAFLGTLAAAAASAAIITASESGLAGWATFSITQAIFTARAIR